MKLSKAQQNDLDTAIYFIPKDSRQHTEEDVVEYFHYSERGIKPKLNKEKGFVKYNDNPIIEGKRWRGIHIHEMYEQGILDGSVPYIVLLDGMPRVVVDFLKKEMFKGVDAEIIENCYDNIK